MNSDKIVEKISSMYDIPLKVDKAPTGIAYDFLGHANAFIDCIDRFPVDGDHMLYPDDLDWSDSSVQNAVAGIGKVLGHEFGLESKNQRSDELHSAMNLPIIAALNANASSVPHGGRVCIVGADRGQNISQCERALKHRPVDWDIYCIEPSTKDSVREKLRRTLTMYPNHHIIPTTLRDAISAGLLLMNGEPIKFDLIIHNLGMHITCGSALDRSFYGQFVNDHLKDGGKFLGTSIDIAAAMTGDDRGMQSPSRSVQVVQVYDPSDEFVDGWALVRVGSTYFHDPILPIYKINSIFNGYDLKTSIVPGKYVFRDINKFDSSYVPVFKAPKNLEMAARRPEVSLLVYVEIERCRKNDVYQCSVEYSSTAILADGWVQVANPPVSDIARCTFSYNHGRPLIPTDLVFMNQEDVYIAPKRNGISARLAVQRGVAYLLVDDGRFYKYPSLGHDDHDMQIQCELMEAGTGSRVVAGPTDVEPSFRLIAVDPYRIGIRSPTTFFERWELLKHLFGTSTVLKKMFSLQTYRKCDIDAYSATLTYVITHPQNADGIVLQNLWAMPGAFKKGLGSARYIKHRYTVDIDVKGFIFEVELSDYIKGEINVLRERKDKKRPNSIEQIKNLMSAMKYSDWTDHMTIAQKRLDITDIPVTLSLLSEGINLEVIPLIEKIAMYRGRFRDQDVLKFILSGTQGYTRDIVYNVYMYFKEEVLKHVIAIHQEFLRNDTHPILIKLRNKEVFNTDIAPVQLFEDLESDN